MDSFQNAIAMIEKMIRTSRLNDLDSLMKVGQAQRILKLATRFQSGPRWIFNRLWPVYSGDIWLSASETIFGRQATLH